MNVVDAVEQGEHDGSGFVISEFLAIFPTFADKLFYKNRSFRTQSATPHKFHFEKNAGDEFNEFVNLDNIGMINGFEDLRFLSQTLYFAFLDVVFRYDLSRKAGTLTA